MTYVPLITLYAKWIKLSSDISSWIEAFGPVKQE